MNFKLKSLYEKVYSNFVKGVYGQPKIASKAEVINKIKEITSLEYVPITRYEHQSNIEIKNIIKSFDNIIDDIDVLLASVENESIEILDQLTNSLKEHLGVKRELKEIQKTADDISNGKVGEDYLKYNFTESFNDTTNIDTNKSDPVNYNAGLFTINKDSSNILTFNHYKGTKIEFNITENYSSIKEYGYVGSSDSYVIFDQNDPRQLIYKIVTSSPTIIKSSFILQLLPDGSKEEINSVDINIDSDIAKGNIRLYYKDSYTWKDIDGSSIQEIKNDSIIFNFKNINTSHLKIEFIKNSPDTYETNTYYFIINNIKVLKSKTKKKATLYSKPIKIKKYSNELFNISNINVYGDIDIPYNCKANVYVAIDNKISGTFVNNEGKSTSYDSPEVYEFITTSGSSYLSEVLSSIDTISGALYFKNIEPKWQQVKFSNNNGEKVPTHIEFKNTIDKKAIDNSLYFKAIPLLFGDKLYTEDYSLSGWVNVDSPYWSTFEPLVNSGIYVSGVNVAVLSGIAWEDIQDSSGNIHPDILSSPLYSGQWIGYGSGVGYPFDYNLNGSIIKFGDYIQCVNGWWRPYVEAITPSGIDDLYNNGSGFLIDNYVNYIPDFYFNNQKFYKIYKFGHSNNLIENSIKLYSYQERPVNGSNDYYPCNFNWNYKNSWTNNYSIKSDVSNSSQTWLNYIIPVDTGLLSSNEEYIVDSISEVKIHNTSIILEEREYQVIYNSDKIITGIDFSSLTQTREYLKPSGLSFDFKYHYKVRNDYLSTWVGYAIVYPGSYEPNIIIYNEKYDTKNINVIDKIILENLDTGKTQEYISNESNIFTLNLSDYSDRETHYKITIFCASSTDTGFCANNWTPYEGTDTGTIIVSPQIKIVNNLNPVRITSFSSLLYDSHTKNKAALIEDNNEKYIIIKEPQKENLPGYYFNSINKEYVYNIYKAIENKGHWVRKYLLRNINDEIESYYYTTGSSGNIYNKSFTTIDKTWNDGALLSEFPNYTGISNYSHHSTYIYPVNLSESKDQEIIIREGDIDPRNGYITGSDSWVTWMQNNNIGELKKYSYSAGKLVTTDSNRGNLFYPTAENLPTYYSISYKTISNITDTNDRFIYKIELLSDDTGSLVPKVKSLRFVINEEV